MAVEKVHDGIRGLAPHGPVFHWKDGWMFCRGEAGDVHIWKTNDPNPPSVELTIPSSEWASIVAALCPQGDNAITHKAALGFHEYGNDPR